MTIFLNLSSRDSLRYHPNNEWHDFTVELPHSIEGKFKCALLEFYSQSALVEDIYVFSNICEPEYTRDSVLPLLRIVSESGEVSHPYYKEVSREVIQRVHIYIKDQNLNVPPNPVGSVRMTLALEPI